MGQALSRGQHVCIFVRFESEREFGSEVSSTPQMQGCFALEGACVTQLEGR
jgi:hypothetical protein